MPQSRRVSSRTRPQHEQLDFHTSKNSLLDQDEDYSSQPNLISPDAAADASFDVNFETAFASDDDDDDDDDDDSQQDNALFEPYHDPQTNRIIMRMRMGNLMDGEEYYDDPKLSSLQYEDSSIVATEVVQDQQSPAWAIFDNPAFDKFSLFHTKSKEDFHDFKDRDVDQDDTPFDQVSYTDPYNAWAAWDSLPTFLQTPYSFMEKAKHNLTSPSNNNRNHNSTMRTTARQKIKQKMKETRINKQGFLEEATITTAASSSSNSDALSSSNRQQQQQGVPETLLEQPYALSKQQQQQQQQPQELTKTTSSTSSSSAISAKEDPATSSTTPRRLSTERLQSPFRQASASHDDGDKKKQDSSTTPRTRLSKSRLESPFRNDEITTTSPVDAPESPSTASANNNNNDDATPQTKSSTPGRLNPGRLKSPFLKEQQDENESDDKEGKLPLSPPKRLSQSRLHSPFLQNEPEQQTTSTSPTRSSPPSSPFHPALTEKRTSPKSSLKQKDAKEVRRKVSLSPPSTPILYKLDENNPSSKLDSILDTYRVMIENKSIMSKDELETIMKQDGHLTPQEIKCFVFALSMSMPGTTKTSNTTISPRRRVKMGGPAIKPSSSSSDAGTATSGNSYSSQRLKARASSKSTPFDQNISNLMAAIKKENVIPSRRSRKSMVRADDDAKTSISVMSSLSCRELSIQRLKRRMAISRQKEKSEVDKLLQDLEDAQGRQKRLEQQLNKAGIQIAEDIPYATAKAEVQKIASQMQEIGTSQATHPDPKIQAKLRQDYFVLEQQMEKYMRALELTDEYLKEQEEMERKFDDDNQDANQEALEQVWKHMPVNIRQYSVEDWLATRTPSGKYIPKAFLLKFARTNILTILRMQPDFVQRAHPSNLEQRRVTGLTLTERRALQAYLYPIATTKWRNAKDALTKRKWNWYCILRQTLKDHLLTWQHHVAQYEQVNGECTCDGFKCPVKANQKLDYFKDDYGYPSNLNYPEYEQPCDPTKAPQPTKPKTTTTTTPKPKPSARHSLMAELSVPKKKQGGGGKRQSLMAELSSQKTKMRARPSSLMDEIAAKAALRQATHEGL